MKLRLRRIFSIVTICSVLAIATASTTAQSSTPIGGVTKSDAVGIGVAAGAIGVGIGIGIYFIVRHGHTLAGCSTVTPDGLRLHSEGDRQTYALVGEIAAVKPGERLRITGKKQTKNDTSDQLFLVEKVSKEFGACVPAPAPPANPTTATLMR